MAYKAKRDVVRKYYKYQYVSWTQPAATSDNTLLPEGVMETSASAYNSSREPWKGFDKVYSSSSAEWFMDGATGWWQVKFPYKIKITGLKFYNNTSSGSNYTKTGRFYTSSNMIHPIGNTFTVAKGNRTTVQVSGIPSSGIITDTICLDVTSSYSNKAFGMSMLDVTATKQNIIEGTSSSYDFYQDEPVYSVNKEIVRKYYKYGSEPNCHITGTLTNNNGVIGGFSSTSYLNLHEACPASNNIVCKFRLKLTSSAFHSTNNDFLGFNTYNSPFGFRSTRKLGYYSGSNWYTGNTVFNLDTYYYVQIVWNGSSYKIYAGTTLSNLALETTWTTTNNVFNGAILRLGNTVNSTSEYFGGVIDLKNSTIEVDNKIWWRGTLPEPSTPSDYDFYRDEPVYKAFNI